jgi:hypothetical protein
LTPIRGAPEGSSFASQFWVTSTGASVPVDSVVAPIVTVADASPTPSRRPESASKESSTGRESVPVGHGVPGSCVQRAPERAVVLGSGPAAGVPVP